MEDGLAIGLVLCGLADRSQIEERLAIYEKVRRNRASSIQMLSNFGFDEAVDGGVADYLEGTAVPSMCRCCSFSSAVPPCFPQLGREAVCPRSGGAHDFDARRERRGHDQAGL